MRLSCGILHRLAHRGLIARTSKLAVFLKRGDQLPVNAWVGRHALAVLNEIRLAGEVANQSARFGDQQ